MWFEEYQPELLSCSELVDPNVHTVYEGGCYVGISSCIMICLLGGSVQSL